MTKEVIRNVVIEELVSRQLLEEEAIGIYTPMSSSKLVQEDYIQSVASSKAEWSAERLEFEKI